MRLHVDVGSEVVPAEVSEAAEILVDYAKALGHGPIEFVFRGGASAVVAVAVGRNAANRVRSGVRKARADIHRGKK